MKLIQRVFDRRGTPVLLAAGLLLFILEGRRQLRKRQQPRWKRIVINSVVAIPSVTLLRLVLIPAMVYLAQRNRHRKAGLNYRYGGPPALKWAATFLLLDYTNYLWHRLMHQWPLLWRFHLVHHSDPDLDLTTAFRFHFGELVGSVFYRGFFVLLSGASPLQVLLYEVAFEGATQFHHANVRLPLRLERALGTVFVTPRMHGIHHSVVRQETDSNYAVIFSFWDRLGGTLKIDVPQDSIVTGVPAYADPEELTVGYLWKLPFTKIRPWPGPNGSTEVRGTGRNELAE